MVSLAVMAAHFSEAQEKKQYEVKNFNGWVNITGPSSLVIEGYAGKSVIIEAEGGEGKIPEKAAGLRMVTPGGVDNTGLSATVNEETIKVSTTQENGKVKEEEVRVLNINIPNPNKLFKNYVIKVPHGLTTRFKDAYGDVWGSNKGELAIRSLEGELDVSCSGCNLNVSGFSGNVVARNSYGGTTRIEFVKLEQDRITSINADGDLEVILPANTRANLKMNSERGNVYTDFDLKKAEAKVVVGKNSLEPVTVVGTSNAAASVRSNAQGQYIVEGGSVTFNSPNSPAREEKLTFNSLANTARARTSGRYDYTINGGGVYVSITSYGGNVYLKKK